MLNYAANLGPLNDTGNILSHWGNPQDASGRTGASSPPSESSAGKSTVVKIVHPITIQTERPQDRSPRKRDRRTAGLMLNPGSSPDMPQGMREPEFKGEIHPPPTKMSRLGMYETYQPWVLQTYGDSAKTKTITRNKYQRILQILRGDYVDNETSKFKLWVKGRGFRIGPPPGFVGSGGGVDDPLKDPLKEPLGITQLSSSGTPAAIDYNPDKDPFPDIYVQTGTIKV
ncbi:uncharacterized protein [Palaemon carinicauda]|uniref:uncharacterized protein n=1 Tax=Palaemon carinicauda TaxID=392227 RepID=UPI0035B6A4BF